MKIEIVYEDENLVVIDKPAGVVVNRAESVEGKTVQDWMEGRLGDRSKEPEASDENTELFWSRGGVVHRLDKDTSGVMVLSKKPEIMVELMSQFKERVVKKEYLALVHGRLSPDRGRIRVPLGRTRKDRKKFGVVIGGKMTETAYRVEEYLSGGEELSRVVLMPKTGRTHQLRVVMAHLGHPIAGDRKYLSKKRAKADKKWIGRQFLHASKLCLVNPSDKREVCFEAELAADLVEALGKVKGGQDE